MRMKLTKRTVEGIAVGEADVLVWDDALRGFAPLNLIVEVKGQRGQDAKEKANALHAFRVPGVNNLRVFGRWPAAEYTAVFDMEAAFDQLVRGVAAQERPMEGRLA